MATLVYGIVPLLVVLIPLAYSGFLRHRANNAFPADVGTYKTAAGWSIFIGLVLIASVYYWYTFCILATQSRPWGLAEFILIGGAASLWFILIILGLAELLSITLEITPTEIRVCRLFRKRTISRSEITSMTFGYWDLLVRSPQSFIKIPLFLKHLPQIIATLRGDISHNCS
jgi:hypothetical protein